MSAKTTVEVSEDASGRVRAVETKTGTTGEGDSVPEALAVLATKLAAIQDDVDAVVDAMIPAEGSITNRDPSPDSAEFFELVRTVRDRFEAEGIAEEDIDEAIEWARSQ